MNAKQINELLNKKGGYTKLNNHERNEVVKFILRSTPINDRDTAINLLKGGLIKSIYKTFLNTVEEKFNPSQRRTIMLALEPIYGKIEEEEKEGGETNKKESKLLNSEEHFEAFKRMPSNVRRFYMKRLKKENPKLYKELSLEINLQRKYKGEVKKHFNQNLNNGLGHIKMKNEDGSYTYY